MFEDTITLFNRYGDEWWPTVIKGVHLNTDRRSIVAQYGYQCKDLALLFVPYVRPIVVADKPYLEPKAWLKAGEPQTFITLAGGEKFDFFWTGIWDGAGPVSDVDFPRGFYDHMNRTYDGVYAITSVFRFKAIPYFAILGR